MSHTNPPPQKPPIQVTEWLPTITNFVLNLFAVVTIKDTSSTKEVIQQGDKKAKRIKIYAIIASTLLVYLGIESNSPNYSFGHCIEVIASNVIDSNTSGFRLNPHPAACKPTATDGEGSLSEKYLLKFSTILALALIFFLRIDFYDKTPDANKLHLISSGKIKDSLIKRVLYRNCHNDIKNYANTVPSRNLPNLCENCTHKKGCKNTIRQHFQENQAYDIWRVFYRNSNIDIDHLVHLVQTTLKCKFIIYLNTIVTDVILILSGVWIIHRAAEYIANEGHYSPVNLSLATMVGGIALLLFTHHHNKSESTTLGTKVRGSIWTRNDKAGKSLLSNQKNLQILGDIFKLEICQRDGGQHTYTPITAIHTVDFTYEVLIDLYEHLNGMMVNKMAHLLTESDGTNATPQKYINNITSTLEEFLRRNFTSSIATVGFSCKFRRNANEISLAVKPKQKNKSLSIHLGTHDGICFNKTEDHPDFDYTANNSAIVVAIKLQAHHQEQLKKIVGNSEKLEFDQFKSFGFIEVISDDPALFNTANLSEFISILNHFSIRIALEVIALRRRGAQA